MMPKAWTALSGGHGQPVLEKGLHSSQSLSMLRQLATDAKGTSWALQMTVCATKLR